MNLKMILKMIERYGEVIYNPYDHSFSCPFCGANYHEGQETASTPCKYCCGSAKEARLLHDSMENILKDDFISLPLETMETLHDHTRASYFSFEIGRRIRAKKKLMDQEK
jgi:hypothetical protein